MSSSAHGGGVSFRLSNARCRRPKNSCPRHGSVPCVWTTSLPNFWIAASYSRGSAVNGYGPYSLCVEIDEVMRRLFLEARAAPQIRIDRSLDDERTPAFEERSDLRRQERNGAIGDETVGVEAPGHRGDWHGQDRHERHERESHVHHCKGPRHSRGVLYTASPLEPRTVDTTPQRPGGLVGFEPGQRGDILQRLTGVRISTFFYKDGDGQRYMGPMAQDFHAAFGLGNDDKTIRMNDLDAVALASIQALGRQVAALQEENAVLRDKAAGLDELTRRLRILEARLTTLEDERKR